MIPECLFKLCPSDEMTFRLNGYEVCPLGTSGASQLLSSKHGLMRLCALDQPKYLFHHAVPLIRLQRFFCFNKDRGMSFQEFHISSVSRGMILASASMLVDLVSCHLSEEPGIVKGSV
jgi:hypothetical protein